MIGTTHQTDPGLPGKHLLLYLSIIQNKTASIQKTVIHLTIQRKLGVRKRKHNNKLTNSVVNCNEGLKPIQCCPLADNINPIFQLNC